MGWEKCILAVFRGLLEVSGEELMLWIVNLGGCWETLILLQSCFLLYYVLIHTASCLLQITCLGLWYVFEHYYLRC